MKNIIPLHKPRLEQLKETGETTFKYPVIPTQSKPRIAPLLMYPWHIDEYGQETDDDNVPCWIGFHPQYPYEGKWFSNDYGSVGRRLMVHSFSGMIEITSIAAEPFDGIWYWVLGLKAVA